MEAKVQVGDTQLRPTQPLILGVRFDRIYIRPSEKAELKADHFGLVGLQKVEGTQSFPSDHWGILLRLVLSQEQ